MAALSGGVIRGMPAAGVAVARGPGAARSAALGSLPGLRPLGLNIHYHSLYLDGVYVTRGAFDRPVFLPVDPLTSAEVKRVHKGAIARIRRVLERHGLDPIVLGLPLRHGDEAPWEEAPWEYGEKSAHEQLLLDFGDARDGSFFPSLKAASVKSLVPLGEGAGRPLKRLIDSDLARAFESSGWGGQYVPLPLVVNADGFSLHAATQIRKGQRAQLEKLCRYVTRPAISLERFNVRPDGMVSWLLRKAWRNGTKGFVMTPHQFMARMAAIVPHPREHQLTYQGVLAPASPLRDDVAPRPVVRKEPKDADGAEAAGGVRAAARRLSASLGGGDPSSPGPSRSPPPLAESDVRIP